MATRDALAQRLILRPSEGQIGRARQGETRAAREARPRALPRELLIAGFSTRASSSPAPRPR
eukprot:6132078-Pyramimonas_sp.AAC.1